MKNKFKTWLNIITICMCFAALAVGVYAASQVSLTVSGSIGFTAFNCKVSVSGYIDRHGMENGVDSTNGLPVSVNNPTPLNNNNAINIEGGVSTDAQSTLPLGNRYFTDMASATGKPDDIYIVISVTNNSQLYKVKAIVDETTMTFGKVQASVVGDKSKILDISGNGATAEFTFKLELTAEADGSYSDITTNLQAVTLKMDFKKYIPIIKSDTIQNTADARFGTGSTTYFNPNYLYSKLGCGQIVVKCGDLLLCLVCWLVLPFLQFFGGSWHQGDVLLGLFRNTV